MKRRPFPRSLAECVEIAAKPALAKHGLIEARLIRDWETIVGAELATRCLPQALNFPPAKRAGGTLTILTTSAYALELQHRQPLILEKLAVYFGYRAVTQLRIKQGTLPARARPAPVPPTLTSPAPPLAIAIEDPELRYALEGLGQALHSAHASARLTS